MKQKRKTTTNNVLDPKTRLAEVLAMFIINKRKWLSHCDFAMDLWQINSHKRIGELKDLGIRFEEKTVPFTNRFDRKSNFKRFRVISADSKVMKVFKKINNRENFD